MNTPDITPLPEGAQFLTYGQVMAITGLRRTSLYNMIGRNEFPRPIQIGPNTVRFLSTDILGWMAAKVAAGRTNDIAA